MQVVIAVIITVPTRKTNPTAVAAQGMQIVFEIADAAATAMHAIASVPPKQRQSLPRLSLLKNAEVKLAWLSLLKSNGIIVLERAK